MRKFLILIVFVCCSAALYGQVDTVRLGYSVQGNVVDAVSGRPMESVHVSVPGRHYATVTNADGDFTIKSDQPVSEVVFSYLGYRTLRQKAVGAPLRIRLTPESMPLAEASIVMGDPREILGEAIRRIPDNYSKNPELMECFYRETVRKRNRYIFVSEAVARLYKTGYDGNIYRDRAALEKSRILLSQRRTDTLSVKMQGGPTQALTFDVVKNPEILFDEEELNLYEFEMGMPTYIGDRLQFVIHFHPGSKPVDWALYNGTLYIELPSGRALCYREPEIMFGVDGFSIIMYAGMSKDGKWDIMQGNGAKFLRDIVQGLARDVLLDAMQRLTDANYPVVLHLANKVIVESEEPAALMAMSAIMEQPPHWANELQLTTQGYACNRYLEKKQRPSRR